MADGHKPEKGRLNRTSSTFHETLVVSSCNIEVIQCLNSIAFSIGLTQHNDLLTRELKLIAVDHAFITLLFVIKHRRRKNGTSKSS